MAVQSRVSLIHDSTSTSYSFPVANLGTPNGNGPYESAVVPAITRSDASDDEVTEAETEGSVASPKFVASPEGGLSPLNSLVHHPDSTPGSQDGGTEEGSEDDDEDDEDEEPALKYERLGGIASEILEKDTASCVGVSQKLIVCFRTSDVSVSLTFKTGYRDPQWHCSCTGPVWQQGKVVSGSYSVNQ